MCLPKRGSFLFLVCFFAVLTNGENRELARGVVPNDSSAIVIKQFPQIGADEGPVFNNCRLNAVIGGFSAMYLGYMSYLQYVWYKDKERVSFHFYNDFKGYNQMDKFGHAYGAYLMSYAGFKSLRWAGLSRSKTAIYGAGMGFLLQMPIEIWDGMYEGWGFSWSDVGANAAGSLLFCAQELIFQEQIVTYKLSFSPSPYAKQANGYLGSGFNQMMKDYNGHTYWISIGLNKIVPRLGAPDWLNLAIGYSAGGMFGEFENIEIYNGVPIPETQRYRQFLLSFDIDLSKIKTRNQLLEKILDNMFIVKVPFPTLEWNTKKDMRLHLFYF